MPFKQRREVTVRLFRDALQWPMYGANNRRTQAHPRHQAAAAVQGRLVARGRRAGRVPRGRHRGRRLRRQLQGHIYALDMRNGKVIWRTRPRGGKMASSPAIVGDDLVVHGMDGIVRVLDRANGKLRWHFRVGSPIESSPIVHGGLDYFGAWNGRVYALDLKRRKLRWSYRTGYKITSSAAIAGQDALHRRLRRPPARARDRAPASGAGSASVNGRVYGTPAVAAGRVFVPSSTGNSLTAFTTSGRYLWRVRHGRLRLLVAGRLGRARLLRLLQRSPLLRLGEVRPRALERRRRRAGLGRRGRRRGRRLRRLDLGPDHRRRREDAAASSSASRTASTCPVSGNGRRLLLHGYSRIWAVEPRARRRSHEAVVDRRRGRARAARRRASWPATSLYKREEAKDVRGSSTEEFVTTEEEEPRRHRRRSRRRLEVVWPMNGYDAERHRVGPFDLRPPFRRIWTFRARQLLEFPPAVGVRPRSTSRTTRA